MVFSPGIAFFQGGGSDAAGDIPFHCEEEARNAPSFKGRKTAQTKFLNDPADIKGKGKEEKRGKSAVRVWK